MATGFFEAKSLELHTISQATSQRGARDRRILLGEATSSAPMFCLASSTGSPREKLGVGMSELFKLRPANPASFTQFKSFIVCVVARRDEDHDRGGVRASDRNRRKRFPRPGLFCLVLLVNGGYSASGRSCPRFAQTSVIGSGRRMMGIDECGGPLDGNRAAAFVPPHLASDAPELR